MTDPIRRFTEAFERAIAAALPEPSAMALATSTPQGRPSVRMVLLKRADDDGFAFYTNLESRKAEELLANPHAALCFHWQPLEIQVRVEGRVEQVEDAEADEYFGSRPLGSQLGAWASEQSRPLSSLGELEDRVRAVEARFATGTVPRPPFWSGFRLVPERIEFWSGRVSRLHERELYTRDAAGDWRVELLYP